MVWRAASVALLAVMAAPAQSDPQAGPQSDPVFSAAERAALGAEIRAVLLDHPGIVDQALNPPSSYRQAVNADIDRLRTLAPHLFDPAQDGFGAGNAARHIALFLRDDCEDCTRAVADLRAITQTHDLRVTLHHLDDNGPGAALAARLELTEAPSYVLPGMMLQGHIPPIVLERYLTR